MYINKCIQIKIKTWHSICTFICIDKNVYFHYVSIDLYIYICTCICLRPENRPSVFAVFYLRTISGVEWGGGVGWAC